MKNLFIMRHAEAGFHLDDKKRALTEYGREHTKARILELKNDLAINRVFHSDFLRSVETAKIIALELGLLPLHHAREVNPESSVLEFPKRFDEFENGDLIVSHLFFIPNLITHLGLDAGSCSFENTTLFWFKIKDSTIEVKVL